jgi:hypothetical protein
VLNQFLDFLKNEWNTVTGAPLSFVTLVIISVVIAYTACRWRYSGVIETLREKLGLEKDRLSAEKDRINAKDSQLDEYRERLHLVPAQGREYSKLTHAELKAKGLGLVSEIRGWFATTEANTRKVADSQWRAMTQAKTEEDKQRLWNAHTNTQTQGLFGMMAEFEKRFKVDAILLRDEMNSRLPDEIKQETESSRSRYEHPVNTFCIREVSDDLERKAKSLC